MLPVGYDLMSRSKWPGCSSPLMGVYERTISLVVPSGWGRTAPMLMCWPMGRPRMCEGLGRVKR